jgi:quinolinate synthase
MISPTDQITIDAIRRLAAEKNAVILAHNYQILPVQKAADFVGDSLQLAQQAAKLKAERIVFAGVRFMAETAKLLNPLSKVLLTHDEAGCPLADMITGEQVRAYKAEHPNTIVVCYVNSSLEVKAECDLCCTSGNSVKIVQSIPADKDILFVPDQNLAQWTAAQTGRSIEAWNGFCLVHHLRITPKDVEIARRKYPDYQILVHPECPPAITELADFVGSTKGIGDYAATHDYLVIGTEMGMVEQLIDKYPEKHIVPLTPKAVCVNMKRTSLRDLLLTILEDRNEIEIDPDIAQRALKSLTAMLERS